MGIVEKRIEILSYIRDYLYIYMDNGRENGKYLIMLGGVSLLKRRVDPNMSSTKALIAHSSSASSDG